MEGIGGDIIFYADILGTTPAFPGYEISFPTLPYSYYKKKKYIDSTLLS